MENKAALHDESQTNEVWPMKDVNPIKMSSSNDYNIVDYDLPWNENYGNTSITKVPSWVIIVFLK